MSEQDKSKKKVDLGNIKTMQDDLDPQSRTEEDKDLDLELSGELSDKETSGKQSVPQSQNTSTSQTSSQKESKKNSNIDKANANASSVKQSQEKSALSGLDFDDEENSAELSEKQSSSQDTSEQSISGKEDNQKETSRLKKSSSHSKKEALDFSQLDDNVINEALGAEMESSSSSMQESNALSGLDDNPDQHMQGEFSLDDDLTINEKDESQSSSSNQNKSSIMKFLILGGVCVVLIFGGVGVFFWQSGELAFSVPFFSEEPDDDLVFDNDQSDNNDQSDDKPSIGDIFDDPSSEEPNDENSPNSGLVNVDKSLTVTLNEDRNVRTQILEQVNTSSQDLIKLTLQGNDKLPLSFTQFIDVFELEVPESLKGNVQDYTLYTYNEEGVYKILGSFRLRSNNASFIVDNWKDTIPEDLQGFTLSTSIRASDESQINQGSQITSEGENLVSYFYNYNGPSSSIDILSYTENENDYIIIGSSQKSFEFFINYL